MDSSRCWHAEMGRMREKLRSISMLVAAADTPVPLIFDSLRLQRNTYTARLRSGLIFRAAGIR